MIDVSEKQEAAGESYATTGLEAKFRDRAATVGVIGLGYVGLLLAVEMAKAGFTVTGIDIDRKKVESLDAGISYVPELASETLFPYVAGGKIRATQSFATVEKLDAVIICVPTPLRKTKDPDLTYVVAAIEAVHNHLHLGQLIILESTTYPGTTRDVVLPILEKSGLEVGRDFYLAYSPERVDPGNRVYTTHNIPKVISGMTERCTDLATVFYRQFINSVVPVSSPEVAEMSKLLETTFRTVNIALVNELALMCHKFAISVWEVIDTANTKPFGFMAFYPGPGVGDSCLSVDPYLTWKNKLNSFEPRLIEVAGQINSHMPAFIVGKVADALNEKEKSLRGSKVLALGVTYKRDANDIRESPALDVLRKLHQKGVSVYYSDSFVPTLKLGSIYLESITIDPALLQSMDCVLVLTDHSHFDYQMIADHSQLVLDCRNVLKNIRGSNVYRL